VACMIHDFRERDKPPGIAEDTGRDDGCGRRA